MITPGAIRLLNLGPTAWTRTQSVYRATAELLPANSPGAVILAQSLHPYLSYGVQQSAAEVFDRAACERLGWPVVRRPLAGEAEYCDVNQLLFQWVLPAEATRPIVQAVLSALLEWGVAAELGSAGFTVRGARLGLVAGGAYGPGMVTLGCLYLAYDPAPLRQALCEARSEDVTTLWAEAPGPLSPEAVQATLLAHFARALGRPIERDTPRVPETRRAKEIEAELLATARQLPSERQPEHL